jgi:hypothetical protein
MTATVRTHITEMTATPNHAPLTGSAVTAPAALHHRLSTRRQVPRPLRLPLSLGSFGDSSRIMKRTIQVLISLFLVLQQVTASGTERDILEIVKEHPLNATVNGVPAKYGDQRMLFDNL